MKMMKMMKTDDSNAKDFKTITPRFNKVTQTAFYSQVFLQHNVLVMCDALQTN